MRALLVIALAAAGYTGAGAVTITPEPIDDLLANPGMGWETFYRAADKDPNLAGLPSGVSYIRFYWDDIQQTENQNTFPKIDEALANARKAGQTLAFRIMCAGTSDREMYVPGWLRENGCPGFEYQYGDEGRKYWVPDMDHPKFLEPHLKLIRRLGELYDGHPDLDHIDVGSVGLWAEWHMSGTGVNMPSEETQRKLIDAWDAAFPKTLKLILEGSDVGMYQAQERGWGWRADCLGDMGGFSKTWNHMENAYLQQIKKTGAQDVWKTAPVAFETCWDMRKWVNEGWDVRYIFDYALNLHTSYINNKSAPIPEGQRAEIERMLRKLGYRLILKRADYPESIKRGRNLKIKMLWENIGVAPPYRKDIIGLKLTGPSGSVVLKTDASIHLMLPGEHKVKASATVPESLAPGIYELELTPLDPKTGEPRVSLAIKNRSPLGWYSLGKLQIR